MDRINLFTTSQDTMDSIIADYQIIGNLITSLLMGSHTLNKNTLDNSLALEGLFKLSAFTKLDNHNSTTIVENFSKQKLFMLSVAYAFDYIALHDQRARFRKKFDNKKQQDYTNSLMLQVIIGLTNSDFVQPFQLHFVSARNEDVFVDEVDILKAFIDEVYDSQNTLDEELKESDLSFINTLNAAFSQSASTMRSQQRLDVLVSHPSYILLEVTALLTSEQKREHLPLPLVYRFFLDVDSSNYSNALLHDIYENTHLLADEILKSQKLVPTMTRAKYRSMKKNLTAYTKVVDLLMLDEK